MVCSDVLEVTYRQGAEVTEYSAMFDSFRRRRLPGQCVVNGRVLVYPFGHFGQPDHIPVMLLNTLRQEILQDVLQNAGARFPMVRNAPYLEPHCLAHRGEEYLYLVNGGGDRVEGVHLSGKALPQTLSVRCSGDGRTAAVCKDNVLDIAIDPMETVLIKLSERRTQDASKNCQP